jgi:3-hydroxyisobutyrate dehydrogenase-like beta-hydroxyacid dehydrogenase
MTLRVCLLGFGEVGQQLAVELKPRVGSLCAWDLKFPDPASGPALAASRLGVEAGEGAAQAVATADVVISAVTAAQAGAAASSVAPNLAPDTWYFDLNSCSPDAKKWAGSVITKAGGRFVEAAIMSPIHPAGAASPMLIGGPHANAFLALSRQLGFVKTRILSDKLGSAAAAKMCRSVLVKGLEALVLESLLAARRHGVDAEVLESLQGFRIDDWRQSARYMASRALLHGARRAEEMREVARTVGEAGLTPHMSSASAVWQEWASAHPELHDEELPGLLDGLLSAIPRRETT